MAPERWELPSGQIRADTQSALDATVESAARLCELDDAQVWLVVDDRLQLVAAWPPLSTPAPAEPIPTALSVPLMQAGTHIGALSLRRVDARPLTDRDVDLVRVLADRLTTTLENARLRAELDARRDQLNEALQQQTATGEVLASMSRSGFDLQTVLEVVLEKACHLCGADTGVLYRLDGGLARPAVVRGGSVELRDLVERNPMPPSRRTVAGRVALERRTVHVPDVLADPEYDYPAQELEGYRTLLGVPIVRGNALLGSIVIWRTEVRPFTDYQIQIVETFASQAGIGLENLRLLADLEARTRDLGTALEQKTATAEILSVTAASTTDLQAVLDAVAERAARLGGAPYVEIRRLEQGRLRKIASYGAVPGQPHESRELDAPGRGIPATRFTLAGQALLERRTKHALDMASAVQTTCPESRELQQRWGHRTNLGIPLLHESTPLGVLSLMRFEVRPFTEQEIQLLETFAHAAAIAISSAGLFHDLQERTSELAQSVQELQALGDVGRVVSSSLDLQQVLTTIVAHAAALSGTDGGVIYQYDESSREFVLCASHNCGPELVEALRTTPVRLGEGAMGRAALDRRPLQIPDVLDESAYPERLLDALAPAGFRALLAVPFMGEDVIVGGMVVGRKEPGAFHDRVLEVVQTFATQSAVAIRNARLFQELEARRADLEQLYRFTTDFQAPLGLRERLRLIVRAVQEVLSFDRAVIWLPTPDEKFLEATAWIGMGLAEREAPRVPLNDDVPVLNTVFRQQAEIILEGSTPVPDRYRVAPAYSDLELLRSRNPAAVPLISRGKCVGVLAADNARTHRAVAPNLELLRTFAASAAVTLENARLLDTAQQELAERRRVEHEIQRKTRLLTLLEGVAVAANEAAAVDEALQTGLEQVCGYTGWPVGHVLLVERSDTGERLVSTPLWHLEDPARFARFREVTAAARLEPGADLPGRALASARPVWVADLERDQTFARTRAHADAGFRAGFAFPVLVAGTEVAAVLEFFTTDLAEPDAPLLEVISHVAAQLARVFERERTDEQLRQAREVAEAADRAKSAFLASMSHELRTPLNAILGYSEMLREEAEDAHLERLIPDLEKIHGAGAHLLGLINDILDLSKIEAGKMDLYVEDFDVPALVRDVAAVALPLVLKNRNVLDVRCPADLGEMRADMTKVRQVLLNLLSNAAKFTHGGAITLTAGLQMREGREWWTFEVRDTGIGITREQVGRLFEAFSQADATTTRTYGGTGLGLAISRRFCRLMSGDIGVESAPGQGSTFTVTLPAEVPELRAHALVHPLPRHDV